MNKPKRIADLAKVAAFLDANKAEFERDPDDETFFVHRRIIAAFRAAAVRQGINPGPVFDAIRQSHLGMIAMTMPAPSQQEFFPSALPGIERFVLVKGKGVFLIAIHGVLSWK